MDEQTTSFKVIDKMLDEKIKEYFDRYEKTVYEPGQDNYDESLMAYGAVCGLTEVKIELIGLLKKFRNGESVNEKI